MTNAKWWMAVAALAALNLARYAVRARRVPQ